MGLATWEPGRSLVVRPHAGCWLRTRAHSPLRSPLLSLAKADRRECACERDVRLHSLVEVTVSFLSF